MFIFRITEILIMIVLMSSSCFAKQASENLTKIQKDLLALSKQKKIELNRLKDMTEIIDKLCDETVELEGDKASDENSISNTICTLFYEMRSISNDLSETKQKKSENCESAFFHLDNFNSSEKTSLKKILENLCGPSKAE